VDNGWKITRKKTGHLTQTYGEKAMGEEVSNEDIARAV
jgi:hypothetical protein